MTQPPHIQSLECQFHTEAVSQLLEQATLQGAMECPRLELGDAFAVAARAAISAYPELFSEAGQTCGLQFGLAALTSPLSWRALPEYFGLQIAARVAVGLHDSAAALPLPKADRAGERATVLIVDASRWGLRAVEFVWPVGVVGVFALEPSHAEGNARIRCSLASTSPIEVGREALILLTRLLESPQWLVGL